MALAVRLDFRGIKSFFSWKLLVEPTLLGAVIMHIIKALFR